MFLHCCIMAMLKKKRETHTMQKSSGRLNWCILYEKKKTSETITKAVDDSGRRVGGAFALQDYSIIAGVLRVI